MTRGKAGNVVSLFVNNTPWNNVVSWWVQYVPSWVAFLTSSSTLSADCPTELAWFRECLEYGCPLTRQGRERYELLLKREVEELMRPLCIALLREGAPAPTPLPLKGSSYLEKGFVYTIKPEGWGSEP